MNNVHAPQRPAHEVRLGLLRASIWRNETENGPRFNTSFSKSYRDGDQWKYTESFGRDDLLPLAKLADLAHTWIFSQAQSKDGGAPTSGGSMPTGQNGGGNSAVSGGGANPGSSNRPATVRPRGSSGSGA